LNGFRAEAASYRSTHGTQGHHHKRIYSIVFMIVISTPESKYVSRPFRLPSSGVEAKCELGSLRGLQEGSPTIFPVPLQGHLQTHLFSFQSPTGTCRKLQAACQNLLADSDRLPKPKVQERAAKIRRRRAIALDFKNIFKTASASKLQCCISDFTLNHNNSNRLSDLRF
jgi:hypothetical protein